jgi:phosphoribosylformylglycinamidine cyclo-ligase
MSKWTYAKAGVDIDRKSSAIGSLVSQLGYRRKGRGQMVDSQGLFTGLIDFGDHYLTLCTDGVGTKLLIAEAMGRWDTIGIDCIAMNVNDTICVGAEPVAFVDYIAIDRPDEALTSEVGKGLEKGAELSNMDIVGGEVAVLPELVHGLDISGTCLGYVDKDDLITGQDVEEGDVIIGLPSSGVHSNGLTLARKVIEGSEIGWAERPSPLRLSVGEELLLPTEIYVLPVLDSLKAHEVHGLVNITGGGLRNLLRMRKGMRYVIDSPMEAQPIFGLIADLGDVEPEEMYQTFNMGMGFTLVCPEKEAGPLAKALGGRIVGHVEKGSGVSVPELGLLYERY